MLCSDIGWLTGGSPRKFRKIHAGLLERVQVAEQVPWWGYATSVAGAGGCGPIKCFKKACAVKAQGSLAQRGRREFHPSQHPSQPSEMREEGGGYQAFTRRD